MSNKLFQGIVTQMKDVIDREVGVLDEGSSVCACSDQLKIGTVRAGIMESAPADGVLRADGCTYCFIGQNRKYEYAVFVDGTDDQAARYAEMIAVTAQNVRQYFDEKYDKVNFIKNVVLDNILPGDVYAKARELRFSAEAVRVVLLVRVTSDKEISALDIISELFPDKQKDFVFNINESDTVIVKEVKPGIDLRDVEKLAGSIVDTLESEHYIKSVVGIGTEVSGIKDLANSFKEAQVALEVGKVFDTEHSIISYDNLGIARLIYQLPTTMCEMFLKEVFKKGSIDSLDQETLFTIQRFFENNLNVSETSRGLFVHRNTLVYRLEKIKKLTGLDLREFDHAIVFKVALMVRKYLDSNPTKY
ncbi:MAG: helix-turn-helix domain-containing protein [Oscillospiraceae bacterium]|nr:helix-turn-helix domain-containing protein [Oscillospiraceae bacterium]